MPYSYGSIYKIICTQDSNFCYIGSTFTTLNQRFTKHKNSYKRYLKGAYGYMSSFPFFTEYGIETFKIILIKRYLVWRESQRDFKNLHAYETLWMNKTKNKCNLILPFNPLPKHDKKEKITCECGCTIARGSISDHTNSKKHIRLLQEI